jgi:hypothetical protein
MTTDWSSQESLQDVKIEGKHTWLNAKGASTLRLLASHLLEARRLAPYSTSACLLLPNANWLPQGFLHAWTRIHAINKGQTVVELNADGETVTVPSKRLVQVYYLAPTANPRYGLSEKFDDFSQTVRVPVGGDGDAEEDTLKDSAVMLNAISLSGRLVMQMAGRVAGADASCLFDSGSEANVISRTFAERQGVVIHPSTGSIEFGDSHVTTQSKTAQVFVQFGAFHKSVPCIVLDNLLGGVDFIIGDEFMRTQHCVLDYGKCGVTFQKGRRKISVSQGALKRDKLSSKVSDSKVPKLLTAMQVKRRVKKGQHIMLGVVSEFKEIRKLIFLGSQKILPLNLG